MATPRRQVNAPRLFARRPGAAAPIALALVCALSACARDSDEPMQACRAVAATLGPPGARVEFLAQSGERLDDGLDIARVDVTLRLPGDDGLRRDFVVCRFAGRSAGRPRLVSAVTERGPVSPSALFFLRRWLRDPAAETPGFSDEDTASAPRGDRGHAGRR